VSGTTTSTGFVWHEKYMWHDTRAAAGPLPAGGWLEPDLHPENAATKRRFKNLLDASGLSERLVALTPRAATVEELCRVHDHAYVERIRGLSAGGGGEAGLVTPFGPGSYEIACLAAGGAITALDAVLDGAVANVYALVRPPGHHAVRDSGMGFCIFANIAVAVKHAQEVRGVERVAVVDWDVHHGNGTQAAFYGDASVLTISLHEAGVFPPGSGKVEENGEGEGAGANLNVPLPPGSGIGAYTAAMEEVVVPALARFRPELIVVASGFDASFLDPLGHQLLHSGFYRAATRLLLDAARRHCRDRLALVHEGGYSSGYVPFLGLATVEELCGERTEVEDPFLELAEGIEGQPLQPHQAAAVQAAAALVARVPAG
jgi:acetoin utilization deacetylase AcuC-like enzyme